MINILKLPLEMIQEVLKYVDFDEIISQRTVKLSFRLHKILQSLTVKGVLIIYFQVCKMFKQFADQKCKTMGINEIIITEEASGNDKMLIYILRLQTDEVNPRVMIYFHCKYHTILLFPLRKYIKLLPNVKVCPPPAIFLKLFFSENELCVTGVLHMLFKGGFR